MASDTGSCSCPIKFDASRGHLEVLEPFGQSLAIGPVALARRQMKRTQVECLERLEHGPVALCPQTFGNMDPEIRIYPDQVRIEGGMVDLRQRDPVGNNGLPPARIGVVDDVGRVQQQSLRQSRQRAATPVGGDHSVAKRRLVQSLLDGVQGVSTFGCVRAEAGLASCPERDACRPGLSIPTGDEKTA